MAKVEGGSKAAVFKELMTYAFTHTKNFLLLLLKASEVGGGAEKQGKEEKIPHMRGSIVH